jgi:hypothetical protein
LRLDPAARRGDELAHRYEYYDNGILKCAVITMLGEDPVVMSFDETGVHHSVV